LFQTPNKANRENVTSNKRSDKKATQTLMTKRIPYILISLTIGIFLYNLLLGHSTSADIIGSIKGIIIKYFFVLLTIITQGVILTYYLAKKTNRLDFIFILTTIISIVLIIDYIDFGLAVSAYKQTNYVIPESIKEFTGNVDPVKTVDPIFNIFIIQIIPFVFQIILFILRQKSKPTQVPM
jgi:hypothetical protein